MDKSIIPMPAYTVERSFYAKVGRSAWQNAGYSIVSRSMRFHVAPVSLSVSIIFLSLGRRPLEPSSDNPIDGPASSQFP